MKPRPDRYAPPLQRLELVDQRFPALFTGEKTSTIRWNEGDITRGFLLYYASDNKRWKTLVWVTEVTRGPLSCFAPFYGQTPAELHRAMRVHYPTIEIDTMVDFVEHMTPQETLATHGLAPGLQERLIMDEDDL